VKRKAYFVVYTPAYMAGDGQIWVGRESGNQVQAAQLAAALNGRCGGKTPLLCEDVRVGAGFGEDVLCKRTFIRLGETGPP